MGYAFFLLLLECGLWGCVVGGVVGVVRSGSQAEQNRPEPGTVDVAGSGGGGGGAMACNAAGCICHLSGRSVDDVLFAVAPVPLHDEVVGTPTLPLGATAATVHVQPNRCLMDDVVCKDAVPFLIVHDDHLRLRTGVRPFILKI